MEEGRAVYTIVRLLNDTEEEVARITATGSLAEAIVQLYYNQETAGADYELR